MPGCVSFVVYEKVLRIYKAGPLGTNVCLPAIAITHQCPFSATLLGTRLDPPKETGSQKPSRCCGLGEGSLSTPAMTRPGLLVHRTQQKPGPEALPAPCVIHKKYNKNTCTVLLPFAKQFQTQLPISQMFIEQLLCTPLTILSTGLRYLIR